MKRKDLPIELSSQLRNKLKKVMPVSMTPKDTLNFLNMHYRAGESLISDAEYDKLEKFYKDKFNLTYNHGHTAGMKGNELEKIRLPRVLPSLSKIMTQESLDKFLKKIGQRVEDLIASPKFDGASGLLSVSNEEDSPLRFMSHGNTKDIAISWHHMIPFLFPNLKTVYSSMKRHGISDIRGEVVISYENFERLNEISEKKYSNPRNAVVGILRNKICNPQVLKLIDFVPYECYYFNPAHGENQTVWNRFQNIQDCGFKGANQFFRLDSGMAFTVENLILLKKQMLQYPIDGVVLSSDLNYRVQTASDSKRQPPILLPAETKLHDTLDLAEGEEDTDSDASRPEWCIAFKSNTLFAETEITNIKYERTRFGKLFPTLYFQPIWLNANYDHCTGKCTAFIVEKGLRIGTKVLIERSGEVIPNYHRILDPDTTNPPLLPEGIEGIDWEWDDNKTYTYLCNPQTDRETQFQRCLGFFVTFKAVGLKEGMVRKIFSTYCNRPQYAQNSHGPLKRILSMTKEDLLDIDGVQEKSAEKLYQSIRGCIKNIKLETLLDASSLIEEGFGPVRCTAIVEEFGAKELLNWNCEDKKWREWLVERIQTLPGFNALADKFATYLPRFQSWWKDLEIGDENVIRAETKQKKEAKAGENKATFAVTKSSSSAAAVSDLRSEVPLPKTVCFTGFRNVEWENLFKQAHGPKCIQSGVSGKTELLLVGDKNENSSKTRKAREKGIKILDKHEFPIYFKLKRLSATDLD